MITDQFTAVYTFTGSLLSVLLVLVPIISIFSHPQKPTGTRRYFMFRIPAQNMVLFAFLYNAKIISGRITMTTFQRFNSTCKKLAFNEFGDPLKVLKLVDEPLPPVQADEVLVKFLVAPVNPADINLVQGVYPIKVSLPAVGGIEGVAEVVETGTEVKNLQPGDRVTPNVEGFGTWRTSGVFKSDDFFKIPKDLSVVESAGLNSNPCTAYRMLRDFVSLQPGDVVIQNGGNSACGQNVIQLCRVNKYISVNVVRNRSDIDSLKSYLKSIGANYVLTEEELRKTNLFKDEIPKPKLALNCVGGRSATEVSRQLANGGIMVTYGGMSREPVTIPTSAFIFKNITFKGFWMTQWTRLNKNSKERQQMFVDLTEYIRSGQLKAPEHKLISLTNFQEAIINTSNGQGYAGCKYMLDLSS